MPIVLECKTTSRVLVMWGNMAEPPIAQAWLAAVNALIDDGWDATTHTQPYPRWGQLGAPGASAVPTEEARLLVNPALSTDAYERIHLERGLLGAPLDGVVVLRGQAPLPAVLDRVQAHLARHRPALPWITVDMAAPDARATLLAAVRGPKAPARGPGRSPHRRRYHT